MNHHLTWEQLSNHLIDGAARPTHAHECESCRSELARIASILREFRGAVRYLSQRADRSGSYLDSRIIATTIPARRMYAGNEVTAGVSSLLVNAAVVAMLIIVGTVRQTWTPAPQSIPLVAPNIRPLPPKPEVAEKGGGSSQNSEAARGNPPKAAPRPFMPQLQTVDQPKLITAGTLVASDVPNLISQIPGDSLRGIGSLPGGNIAGPGIGGKGGPGGAGDRGDGIGSQPYRPGGGVSPPVALITPEPEYSEEARKAKWQGAVTLQIVVDEAGKPKDIRVLKALGLGLDQKAIDAVMNWRFKPGMKDGKAVPVFAIIQVTFRLL